MFGYLRIHYLIAFCLVFLSNLIFAQNGEYKFKHIAAKEGLSAPSVYSIIKDKQGFIWLATGIGLFRYDGYEFRYFYNNPNDSTSLSGNLLTAQLFIDDSGDLWVGTKDHGLTRFNIYTEKGEQFEQDANKPGSISSNNIHKVMQDSFGNIWVATHGGGLNKFNKQDQTFSVFLPNSGDFSDKANWIQSMIQIEDSKLLVGTRKGLYLFDIVKENFTLYSTSGNNFQTLHEEIIVDLIDEKENLWIATENGLIKFNKQEEKLTNFHSTDDPESLSSNAIRHMINSPDKEYLWISTFWGLNRFCKKTNKNHRFLYNPEDPNSLGYNMLWGLYIDNTDLLWIGTDYAGVNVLNVNKNPFRHYSLGGYPFDKEQFSATVFCEDNAGDFWVGSFEGGLWQFDTNTILKHRYTNQNGISGSLTGNSVFSIFEDAEGVLWVGTSGGGVNRLNKNSMTSFKLETNNSQKVLPTVIEIQEDSEGIIWLGTFKGLYFYDKKSNKGVENIGIYPLNNAMIRSICKDRKGNLWVGTHSEGLFKFETKDSSNPYKIINFANDPHYPNSISSNTVMSIYEDYGGNIWLATIQGLNKYVPGKNYFEKFEYLSHLGKGFLYHIRGDKNDILWITCSKGLVRFDQKADSNQMSKLFEFEYDGLYESIYPYSFFINDTGEIYIGGKYGVNYGYYKFDPARLRTNKKIPALVLTNFLVKNEKFVSDTAISAKKSLLLKHNQNFFSFEFAALDYSDSEKNQYAYYLEGFENDWNYSGNRRYANYTGVPPGQYIFRVKGSNNDGYWNETGASIAITILHPRWRTWWAYVLYALSFLIIMFSMFYAYLRRQQLIHKVERLEEEKKMLAARSLIEGQEDERKRIAEELHDGLGILLSAAKIQVSSIKQNDNKDKSKIDKASKLLEQATKDVRKISHNMMPGLLTKFGLFEALKDLVENVNNSNNISAFIKISGSEKRLPGKTEIMLYRIIQELINNTLKHAEAKNITIKVTVLPDQLEIIYTDDGKGFDITTSQSNKSIGLQSIHSRLDFLNGRLTFESEKDKGAAFYLKVPI